MSHREASPGRVVGAVILIGLGVLFLVGRFISFDWLWNFWPLIVMAPGLVFLFFAFTGSADASSLAIPGAIITGTGAILFFQSITNRWESWAYIWALYPVFLGLGLIYMGRRTGNTSTARSGRGFVNWGLVAFLVLGGVFEVFIFGGVGDLNVVFPVLLILFGGWLLLRPARRDEPSGPGPKAKHEDAGDPFFTGAPDPRPRGEYAPSASDRLRRQIDEALAEDDDLPTPEPMDEE